MSLKQLGSLCSAGLILLLFFLPTVMGDTVEGDDVTRSGNVVGINSQGISFLQGCRDSRIDIPWDKIRYVQFDDSCEQRAFASPGQSGATAACIGNRRPTRVFSVTFKKDNVTVYATHVTLDDDTFRISLVNSRGTLSCDAAEVKSKVRFVSRGDACPETLANFALPTDLRLSKP